MIQNIPYNIIVSLGPRPNVCQGSAKNSRLKIRNSMKTNLASFRWGRAQRLPKATFLSFEHQSTSETKEGVRNWGFLHCTFFSLLKLSTFQNNDIISSLSRHLVLAFLTIGLRWGLPCSQYSVEIHKTVVVMTSNKPSLLLFEV